MAEIATISVDTNNDGVQDATITTEPETTPAAEIEEDYTWLTERLDALAIAQGETREMITVVLSQLAQRPEPSQEIREAMEAFRTLNTQLMEQLTMTQSQLTSLTELVSLRLTPQTSTSSSQTAEQEPTPPTTTPAAVEGAQDQTQGNGVERGAPEAKRRRRL